ncbi:MAG: acyl-CoA dehydratase activase [Candidatus Kapaibacterium sp.]
MKQVIGVCLGASSISFVRLGRDNGRAQIGDHLTILHNGDPKGVFLEKLREFNKDRLPVAVTGRKFRNTVNLPSISEPEAIERAMDHLGRSNKFTSVASLGGETFIVYSLDKSHKISNIITRNQCASGTGEFFMQQIKRMGLSLGEAVDLADGADPFRVSGRCSVFCKSDCTHALNKGVNKSEVTAGLARMIAEKVEELLGKTNTARPLIIGGVTRNRAVMNFLSNKLPNIYIPQEAAYFEALGAAYYALDEGVPPIGSFDNILTDKQSSFVYHRPLTEFADNVRFETMAKSTARDGDECTIGLDVGSTTTKAVLIRRSDKAILASVYLYTNGDPIGASRKCYSELAGQIEADVRITGLGATGSGRHIAGLHAMTDGVFNEIIAHATAAVHFDPEVDTIFEIGGQDAKYTYIVNKVPADYAMNEACSAGTGSFIEESAYESLRINVTDIEKIALKGANPPNFSDQCAAFISSDIKTALQENNSREDVVAGLVYSICLNYVNRVKGNRPVGKKIFMQGGVCYNKAIPIAMAALTGREIIVPPEPGLMGAYGVALEVDEKQRIGLLGRTEYDLRELASRDVNYRKPFICRGGREKCDLGCSINMIEVLGKVYPFGGACDKYYNLLKKSKIDPAKYDHVSRRNRLMFGKYSPAAELPGDAPTVGVNLSFHSHALYPLYYNFLTNLGFRVVLPDNPDEEGLERELSSFCYPGQLSLMFFNNLAEKEPDYYFVPLVLEMYVEDAEYHRLDFNCSCAFVSGEPLFLSQAYKDKSIKNKMITPHLNFSYGWDSCLDEFIKAAAEMGIKDRAAVEKAYNHAAEMQRQFQDELWEMGREFMNYLESNPDEFAMVLIGRPYNTFADSANKGIPRKFASRGIHVLPYEMFDYRGLPIEDNMYWESGKKILKSAQLVKSHPQLFATYVSNFSCAPDSMIMTTFRSIMGSKPSLTLELDGHTADAGINTRIDAAVDIIHNYLRLKENISDTDYSDYRQAGIDMDGEIGTFIDSDGRRIKLDDPDVVILVPSMGDIAAPMFAATLRGLGFRSEALPEATAETLKYGRAMASGKECLPVLILLGGLLEYMDKWWDGKSKIAYFIVQGAGNCRLGQYPVFIRDVIRKKRMRDVAPLTLMNEDGFAGLGSSFSLRGLQAIIASDVMDDIRSGILAHAESPERGMELFDREYAKVLEALEEDPEKLVDALGIFADAIRSGAPARKPIEEARYIAMVGEIFVRRDGFSHKWLNKRFAEKGFILKDAYISEWIFYVDYLIKKNLLEPDKSIKKKVEHYIRTIFMRQSEKQIKKALARSGYYKYSKTELEPILEHSEHIVPLDFKGEPGITVGIGLHEGLEKYCGIINIGPFGCMPTRISESVSLPEMNVRGKIEAKRLKNKDFKMPELFNGDMNIPFLTIETDGNVYPQVIEARLEMFALQAARAAELMKMAGHMNSKNGKNGITENILINLDKLKIKKGE